MVSSSQIREQLASFLEGQIDLSSFEDWFVQNTWNIHLSGSVAAEDLTFAVEESLAEYSSQHISEQELRHELGNLIQRENKLVVFALANAPQKPRVRVTSAGAVLLTARL